MTYKHQNEWTYSSWSTPVRTSQQCVIPQLYKYHILVTNSAAHLISPNAHCNMARNRPALTAKCIIKVVPNWPYFRHNRELLCPTYPRTQRSACRNCVYAVWPKVLLILQILRTSQGGSCKEVSVSNDMNITNSEPIHFSNAIWSLEILKSSQMQRPRNMKHTDAKWLESGWTEGVRFNENYDEYKDELFDMLSEFRDIRDGPLAWMNTAKLESRSPCWTLDLYNRHCAEPYCKTASENKKISKMRRMHVIEQAQLEWAARILFTPKIDGYLRPSVNHEKLSPVSAMNSCLLPRMEEHIDLLAGAGEISI